MKPPFRSTDIDLFHPIPIKLRSARIKRWGALITCSVTQAVHIEVVEGLDSFVNGFVTFISHRGKPDNITSDCRTTVKEQQIRLGKVNEFAVKENITWNFNPPASPHKKEYV